MGGYALRAGNVGLFIDGSNLHHTAKALGNRPRRARGGCGVCIKTPARVSGSGNEFFVEPGQLATIRLSGRP